MKTAKKLLTNTRIIILLVALFLSLLAIHPNLFGDEGVAIRTVAKNSSAQDAGLQSPGANDNPMSREIIEKINNIPITTEEEYFSVIESFQAGDTLTIKTNEDTYLLNVKSVYQTIENGTVNVTEEVFDEELNTTINVTTEVTQYYDEAIGVEDIGLTVYPRPNNNIRKGLDLEGGTRVLLEPETVVSEEDMGLIIENIKQRLNVYGVSDVVVRQTKDLDGNLYIAVEIAGVNKDEVRELLGKQGKFEAKVGSTVVFIGGQDITNVCRTPDCSGIDTYSGGCGQQSDGSWTCATRFSISLTPEAAEKMAAATENLEVLVDGIGGSYLSENITLYLDDQEVDSLRIAAGLKGSKQTDISITGAGSGLTYQEAQTDALANMKQMQTVLITGSLPVKLDIVKSDAVSPILGETFLKNILLVGLLSILAVVVVVFIRYREWKISVPMVITMLSEVTILLGVASLIGWRLDLAAIAGIIIAVGTGVDDQIVIADEIMRSEKSKSLTWQERLKRAFFIIMAAYFTTVVAMLPLWFAGAGILKGFALTTILGVTIGVFITRPAYSTILERIMQK